MPELFLIAEPGLELLRAEALRAVDLVRRAAPWAEAFEVGSTAVPGVLDKGDIDLLAQAPAADFDRTRAALDAALMRNPDQLSNDQYQGYTIASPLDVAVQLTVSAGGAAQSS